MLRNSRDGAPGGGGAGGDGNSGGSSGGRATTAAETMRAWVNYYAVAGYMTCSALMLIANKLAVHFVPAPAFVLFCQLAGTAAVVAAASALGLAEVDALEWSKVKRFAVVPLAFLCTIYANIKILQHANVETFITFRASTPLLISIADYVWLGRELPSTRSWACLVMLLVGAACYAYTDNNFSVDAYLWVVVWFSVFSFDQIYIKHKLNTVKMSTYYSNLIGAVPMLGIMLTTGELQTVLRMEWGLYPGLWLAVSVLIGCSIAYFSFLARAAVSATSFTVIGNTCKVLTVFINVSMWNAHASPTGLVCLFVCLVAAYYYRQAPLRAAAVQPHVVAVVV